ncbi:hypothetical protein [Archangium sp.]|uniref:hypothetical protein n=1 Tax=Archangium sp. TaxID=1872627 RepID=UPI00286AB505|nr:hypothetical protein [Archangium sp.]
MTDLFERWPTVQKADALIRNTRPPDYFPPWDKFTRAWARALKVSDEQLAICCGPNLGAIIDTLFEQAPPSDETHASLESAIQAATEPEQAKAILAQTPNDALSALRNQIAVATELGCEKLASRPILARRWLEAWSEAIRLHAAHQSKHEKARARAHLPPDESARHKSFEDAVAHYVESFTHTDAFSTTMIAIFPCLSFASEALLEDFVKLSKKIAPFMRVIADVIHNDEEDINIGLFTLSHEHGISLAIAKKSLYEQRLSRQDVQVRMANHAADLLKELQLAFDEVLRKHGEPERTNLSNFFELIKGISLRRIHEAHPELARNSQPKGSTA